MHVVHRIVSALFNHIPRLYSRSDREKEKQTRCGSELKIVATAGLLQENGSCLESTLFSVMRNLVWRIWRGRFKSTRRSFRHSMVTCYGTKRTSSTAASVRTRWRKQTERRHDSLFSAGLTVDVVFYAVSSRDPDYVVVSVCVRSLYLKHPDNSGN